ncbi:PT domain-containing protein [Georgenia satyanarayanai]|uniref:PT domain-containing protein n=1 Tax=Georgenia satyanarayanai TaxID=860221 RepID=UPI001264C52F|nr:PT domain-containing protein [Georgenia satyanarayanai]
MTAEDAPRAERPPLPAHLRRRRRLLAWSAPVVLAFLVTGSLLVGTVLGAALGSREFDALRFPEAARQYQAQQRWTGVAEPWKAWFNSGTAQYRAEEHFLAVEDLRVALDLVPEAGPLPDGPEGSKAPEAPECRVRTNLSLAIEAMGDVAATDDEDPGMAEVYYAEAQEVIAPCTSSQDNEESSERQKDKEQQAREDQQEPQEQPSDQPSGEPGDEPTDEPSDEPTDEPSDQPSEEPSEDPGEQDPTDEPSDDPRRDELEERNREAERDRQEQQERGGGGFGGGQNW